MALQYNRVWLSTQAACVCCRPAENNYLDYPAGPALPRVQAVWLVDINLSLLSDVPQEPGGLAAKHRACTAQLAAGMCHLCDLILCQVEEVATLTTTWESQPFVSLSLLLVCQVMSAA